MHKKEKKNFVAFRKVTIFAIGNIADGSNDALLGTLCDRLANFDLVKSGKLTLRCQKLFSQVSHVPFEGHGLLFYHLLTPGIFQNLTRTSVAKVRACPFFVIVKRKNIL